MRCSKCGEEWSHAEEDCYLNDHIWITDYPDLCDRVYDQIKDEAMVMGATKEVSPVKDGDN